MAELLPIISELLKKRGIESEEDRAEFMSEKPRLTYDPLLMLNLEKAAELILSHVERGSRICIYGDYDADGVTSTAVMYTILSELLPSDRLRYYIPSRFSEGYGLNNAAIDRIKEDGCALIVTVDCGCVSCGEVEHAKAAGLDIVVTDHHSMGERTPDCIVVNPRQEGCGYPFKGLAGVGVAFKLVQAIQRKAGLPKSVVTSMLDLVAVGTIGDVMPMLDENRTIVKYGLKALKSGKRESLKALAEGAQLDREKLNEDNVAFVLVPHLNAVGRLEDAATAEDFLLTSGAEADFSEKLERLLECNRKRKAIQDEIYESCLEKLGDKVDDKIIIVKPNFSHEGIAGIVAGKLRDRYYRPCIVISDSGELLKGTGRSIEGINIHELLSTCAGLFEKYGGHSAACGFSVSRENYERLKPAIEEAAERLFEKNPELFERDEYFDADLSADDISEEFIRQLELLAPFGKANPKPVFRLRGQKIRGLRYMGGEGKHAKFLLDGKEGTIEAVLFSKAAETDCLREGGVADLYGTPELSVWNGNKRLQFRISDMKADAYL